MTVDELRSVLRQSPRMMEELITVTGAPSHVICRRLRILRELGEIETVSVKGKTKPKVIYRLKAVQ